MAWPTFIFSYIIKSKKKNPSVDLCCQLKSKRKNHRNPLVLVNYWENSSISCTVHSMWNELLVRVIDWNHKSRRNIQHTTWVREKVRNTERNTLNRKHTITEQLHMKIKIFPLNVRFFPPNANKITVNEWFWISI